MTPIPFLLRLSANNDRAWMAEHRAEYDAVRAQWLADLQRFIDACSLWEPAYGRLRAADCAFRIHRDTRFSPDKTPYKTFFSAYLGPRGRKINAAGLYISCGVNPDADGLFGGLWNPDAAALRKMRRAIVDNIEEWEAILAEPELQRNFPQFIGATLKTIPKGWDRNHPQAHYLRLLHYGREYPVDATFWADPDWPERAAAILRPLKPLIDFINYTLFEE